MESLCGPSGYKGPGVGGISRAESVGRLSQCGHQYHLQCLVAMYNNGNKDGSLQCPTCKTIYGVKTGNQPPGKMEYHVIPHSLPGHPDCKTIRIIYNIPPGIQVRVTHLQPSLLKTAAVSRASIHFGVCATYMVYCTAAVLYNYNVGLNGSFYDCFRVQSIPTLGSPSQLVDFQDTATSLTVRKAAW